MKLDKITWVAALLMMITVISSVAAQAPEAVPAAPETTPNRAGTVRIGMAAPEVGSFADGD